MVFQNEPSASTEVGSTASNMRLLTTSWMNAEAGTSGRGDFVASTIDVDAIKVRKVNGFDFTKKCSNLTLNQMYCTVQYICTYKNRKSTIFFTIYQYT